MNDEETGFQTVCPSGLESVGDAQRGHLAAAPLNCVGDADAAAARLALVPGHQAATP